MLIKIYLIKINHVWTQLSINTRPQYKEHLKNTKVYLCPKGEKCGKIKKGCFSKIAETVHRASSTEAVYSEHLTAFLSFLTQANLWFLGVLNKDNYS